MLYYTYWDLITSIYSVCGYESKTDVSVANNHGVTGKQAWDNFVTFVENSAKANYKFVGDGMSKAFSELENLVNTATEKGISMTQDLYDMLKSVFANQVALNSSGNFFDDSDFDAYAKVIAAICGTAVSVVPHYGFFGKNLAYSGNVGESQSYLLNIVSYDNHYYIFEDSYNFESSFLKSGGFKVLGADWGRSSLYAIDYDLSTRTYIESVKVSPVNDVGYSWLIRNGQIVSSDVISVQVSAGACPKEVPDVVPWRKDVAIPDEWRVIEGDDDSGSDDDKKKRRHVLPIPIILPNITIDPDDGKDSEKDTEKDSQKDNDPDRDPDHEKDVDTIIDDVKGIGDITKLFPFCIPFDIVELIRGMSAERKPPHFVFKHRFDKINYTFKVDVDLSDYDKYIKLFRYGMQVLYVLALMFLTARISNYFS